jgi:dUTP pyrophosphatase
LVYLETKIEVFMGKYLVPLSTYFDPETNQIVQIPTVSSAGQQLQRGQFPYVDWLNENKFHALVPELKVKKLSEDAILPTRSHPYDAGLDLYSAEDIEICSRHLGNELLDIRWADAEDPCRVLVGTGIAVEVPPGLGLFIWDRSGLSVKYGLHRVAGICDSGYRGELKVALVNLSNKSYQIKKGDRIAQAVLAPIVLAKVVEVPELSDTSRGADGFGSTGS